MKFLSYDSKFSQFFIKVANACFLNMLWVLCSLPVFTIGAATTALYSMTLRLVRDEEGNLMVQFFRAFKENFKQSTQIWLILLGMGILLGADGYVLYHLYRSTTGPMGVFCTLALALIIVAAIIWVIVAMYVFPLVASVTNTNRAMLKNAFLIGVRYLFCTILVAAIHFAMFFAVVAIFTPLVIFGEGACALVSSYLFNPVIQACSYDPNAPKMAEESLSGDEEEE